MGEKTDNSQPPREWPLLRFHLSTAIILTFVAGGLLWANLHHRVVDSYVLCWDGTTPGSSGSAACRIWGYGFPFSVVQTNEDSEGVWRELHSPWQVGGLLCDVAFAIVVLFLVGSACEWLIRRRERKEEAVVKTDPIGP